MKEWWRGAVIYQIYPRSFRDANGDGVGDLRGVISRLDHISSLGVDGIWLSPFFRSPMRDFGYDVSDYCDVDPIFGTLEDFDVLLREAHRRDLKVIIDQVYSHTSDLHPWFKESRSSRDNPKSDWYVWANAKDDGGPPNNWISLFGGQAWSWDTRRRQYYMHNFLREQPDLNFRNPAVRAAVLDVARFWLDRGVDGFRLDVANFYFCDARLRDNPPKREGGGFARPYQHQRHLHDRSQPENLKFMETIREVVDQYDGRMTVAEIGSDSYIQRSIEYTAPGRLHTAYNFMLLENGPLTPALIREAVSAWDREEAWPSWSFSNHDVVRARTRWGGADAPDDFAVMLLAALLCLRGTIFLYQGEELGLMQANVPFERLQDPEGKCFWPDNLGRDGCRTPMPWRDGEKNAGFSPVDPWLPVDPSHLRLSVDRQSADPGSILNKSRRFIDLRARHAALRLGDIEFVDSQARVLAFTRTWKGETLFCAFNFGDAPESVEIPAKAGRILECGLAARLDGCALSLPPLGGAVVKCQP